MWVIDLTLITLGLIGGIILFFSFPIVGDKNSSFKRKVSVIIPCRNEEINIGELIDCLIKSDYPLHEIICVDDNSNDRTAEIIQSYSRVKLITIKSRPDGWNGKPYALTTGARAATGDVLLFLDADVRLSERAIGKIIGEFEQSGIVSIQPYHRMKKLRESLSLLFNMVSVAGTGITLPRPKQRGMFGPVLMIDREQYFNLGAHDMVKSSVIEDYDLGRYYSKNGIKYSLKLGNQDISFRMYPESLASQKEGFVKNIVKGASKAGLLTNILTLIWIFGLTSLPILMVKSYIEMNIINIVFSSAMYLINILYLNMVSSNLGNYNKLIIIFYPIALLWFHYIFAMSLIRKYIIRSVNWKGRKIKI